MQEQSTTAQHAPTPWTPATILHLALTLEEWRKLSDREREEDYSALRDQNRDLLAALEHALPYMEHAVKFFKYQRAGHEFWPNREEAEANIQEAAAAIASAKGTS